MSNPSRRAVLAGAATLAAATATDVVIASGSSPADAAVGTPANGPNVVTPDDPRYPQMVVGYNQRWVGTPDAVVLPTAPAQVEQVVREAIRAGKRVSVRSGGHCYADFVYNPEVKVVIDLSTMNQISWDSERKAVCVEAGAQLGPVYEKLYRDWGITIPAGICLTVGVGGHASGGGFGLLSRMYGFVVDHVEAVEVVVVNAAGAVRTVVASRDPQDPAHDLWWAVTGGGGGTFGIVTRFWFRSPAAIGADPGGALPAPPPSVLISSAAWPWSQVDEETFAKVVTNYAIWHVDNSAPGAPGTSLCSILFGLTGGGLSVLTQADAAAGGQLDSFNEALVAGTALDAPGVTATLDWLTSTKVVGSGTLLYDPTLRSALKTAWLREGLTTDQLRSIYQSLTTAGPGLRNGVFQLISVGGAINAVPPTATSSVHRSSVMFAEFETFWSDAADDEANLAWLRGLYGGAFAGTGGYPVPSGQTDGCYINNPDPDITNPTYNKSGVPWATLYFGANYAQLQRVKARWDPSDFFRHSQSVQLP